MRDKESIPDYENISIGSLNRPTNMHSKLTAQVSSVYLSRHSHLIQCALGKKKKRHQKPILYWCLYRVVYSVWKDVSCFYFLYANVHACTRSRSGNGCAVKRCNIYEMKFLEGTGDRERDQQCPLLVILTSD